MNLKLEIFIEPDCRNCEAALDIAAMVRQQVPAVQVSVVDVSQPHNTAPAEVFAVPTYLVNGETWSLGNPEGKKFVAELKSLVKQSQL